MKIMMISIVLIILGLFNGCTSSIDAGSTEFKSHEKIEYQACPWTIVIEVPDANKEK